MKTCHLLPAACLLALSAWAQTPEPSDLFRSGGGDLGAAAEPTPFSGEEAAGAAKKAGKGDDAKSGEAKPAGPTTITSTGDMTYDERTRMAIFTGPYYGVFVKDPQFTVNCDKLTALMRKTAAPGSIPAPARGKGSPGTKPAATPRAPASPKASPGSKGAAAADKASGLQRAIAEGGPDRPVVIVQEKPGANGGPPEYDIGIAAKADYDSDTGDVVLTGWPQVKQGINTQIATSEKTTMTMNRNNNTMMTHGPSRTVVQQQATPKPEPTATPSPSPFL